MHIDFTPLQLLPHLVLSLALLSLWLRGQSSPRLRHSDTADAPFLPG